MLNCFSLSWSQQHVATTLLSDSTPGEAIKIAIELAHLLQPALHLRLQMQAITMEVQGLKIHIQNCCVQVQPVALNISHHISQGNCCPVSKQTGITGTGQCCCEA